MSSHFKELALKAEPAKKSFLTKLVTVTTLPVYESTSTHKWSITLCDYPKHFFFWDLASIERIKLLQYIVRKHNVDIKDKRTNLKLKLASQ